MRKGQRSRMRRFTQREFQRAQTWMSIILCSTTMAVCSSVLRADSTFVYAVQISAVVQTNPPEITLFWEVDPYGANTYTIYRKAKSDASWGEPLATLDGSESNYTDNAVSIGSAYEYQIIK